MPYKLRAEVSSSAQLSEALADADYGLVYAPLPILGEKTEHKEKIVVVPPVFIGGNEKEILGKLSEMRRMGFGFCLAHTLGHIGLIKKAGMEVLGGFRLNITNSESFSLYSGLGLKDIILSPELTFRQINNLKLGGFSAGIIAYGAFPLMTLLRCPLKNDRPCGKKTGRDGCAKGIADRYGQSFPLLCGEDEVFLLNPDKLYLGDKVSDLISPDFAVLFFTGEKTLAPIKTLYLNGEKPERLGEKFTRGIYYRGVN